MKIRLFVLSACWLLVLTSVSPAIEPEVVVKNLRDSFSQINDYTVQIHAEADIKSMQIPPMDVIVYFKQPDKIHFKSTGFAMLPREGLFFNPDRLTGENFYMTLTSDSLNESTQFKLEFIPKNEQIQARKLIIWVDPARWVVSRIQTISWQGQTTQINFEHRLIEKKYWLPQSAVIDVNLSGFRGFADRMGMPDRNSAKEDSMPAKNGVITVKFSKYKINSGLPDSIFDNQIK